MQLRNVMAWTKAAFALTSTTYRPTIIFTFTLRTWTTMHQAQLSAELICWTTLLTIWHWSATSISAEHWRVSCVKMRISMTSIAIQENYCNDSQCSQSVNADCNRLLAFVVASHCLAASVGSDKMRTLGINCIRSHWTLYIFPILYYNSKCLEIGLGW